MTQQVHPMLPKESDSEKSRGRFVQALKSHIANRVTPGVRELYEHRAKPGWETNHGKEPQNRHEVRQSLTQMAYYQLWSSLRRTSQHLLWSTVADCIERQAKELSEAAKIEDPIGSLQLNPNLELPWYQWDVDIHAMPGGYRGEYGDDDVFVGALYDRGVYLYAMGQMGALNDDYGQSIIDNYLSVEHQKFTPEHILDMGCTVGHATLPYAQAFPTAEVYAIDLGAPVLRYGHARAEALGESVHFSQQNCEETDFPDEKFDLIVSHIVLHELPPEALRRTFAECHRLLKSGGLMVHADFPGYEGV
ncbi:MAG TPA: class I SAM-dependent methyltransferase, partial [Acidimicrobiales bacterium]|nr:class I SAM-dependent methyltransferase [Acidimicrobiales bacterium]